MSMRRSQRSSLHCGRLEAWSAGMPTAHVCPRCQSKEIGRARRQDIFERLILRLRRKRRYRCLDCDHHFCDHPGSTRSRQRGLIPRLT